ncbi:hypothetical protein J3R82DRAFT_3460 [Butyriboletus roseoflavus]|nr:hypothetical protein J3R82DRAFT_7473 [Butyriboletus roseoflavus]KAG8220363.1 hypothetical protein J3R82DRAFT_3460 [Butyriboletus roseoflavus]
MSATEIINSLGIQGDHNLVVELDEHLAAADEVHSLEQHATATATTKLALVGSGSTIYAKFSPGPAGTGPCTKKGTGAFASSKPVSGLSGNYQLEVGRVTVKLQQGSKVIWSGTGLQKGLSGTWNIKL